MKNYIVQRKDDLSLHIIKSSQFPISPEYDTLLETDYDDIKILNIIDQQDTMIADKIIRDVNGDPIMEDYDSPTYDNDGNPILDGNGDPVTQVLQRETYELDGNGNRVQEEVNDGLPYKVAVIDPVKVAAKEAAQVVTDKLIAIKNLETIASDERKAQRLLTFGTEDKNSATAKYLTWKRMVENPAMWSGEGLVSPTEVLNADLTVLFNAGDIINTDALVTSYATRMLEIVDVFGVWLAKRDQTLAADIATLP